MTNSDDAPAGRASVLPTHFDLQLASTAAAIWCLLMSGAFHRNGAAGDLFLFAVYLAAHFAVVFAAVAIVQGIVAGSTGRRLTPRMPRLVRHLMLLAAPIALLAFASMRALESGAVGESEPIHVRSPAPGPERPRTVKLIGVDGLDLGVLDELVGRGQLPNFRRLLEQGATAPLTTISPHSPVVWTTLATGAPPEEHQVRWYTTDYVRGTRLTAPDHPLDVLGRGIEAAVGYRQSAAVSSNERRSKAIWELLSQLGRRSLMINWWATYPAEPIAGVMVSNRAVPWSSFDPAAFDELRGISNLVWPEERVGEVRAFARGLVRERGGEKLERNAFNEQGSRFFALRDDVVLGLFRRLLDPGFVLASVYLQDVDTGSHAFSQTVFGHNVNQRRPPRISREAAARLWEDLVGAAYRRMDSRLGELLADTSEDECLVLVSDHGWRYDGTGHWALPDGVFLAWGRSIAAGKRFDGAHVYDVMPTVAFLLGVPVSRALPGRVLQEALEPPLASRDIAFVDSYGSRRQRVAVNEQGTDDAHLERLRSLGYIE